MSVASLVVAPKKSFLMLGGERTCLVLAVFGVGHYPVKRVSFCFLIASGPELLYSLAEGMEGAVY